MDVRVVRGTGMNNPVQDTRMECKVCWYVYDPKAGDDFWQVPPGTPFAELPSYWSCPQCSTMKTDFLLVPDE